MSEVFKFEGDQVQLWIEQEVIHLRAVDMAIETLWNSRQAARERLQRN